MTAAVAVRDLVKVYPGGTRALTGLSCAAPPGRVLGLLGPNGAGKTTAIAILCGLLRPTSGAVTICGADAVHRPRAARRHLGLVPQELALYPNLTGRENLTYFGRIYGLRGPELSERVDACLAAMGLAEHADKRIDRYSGGMKRRANLAAGMLHRPKVLLLDEPTVGIDAQSRNMILEHLRELRGAGATLIYTTHYMEEAQALCDEVVIVDHGRAIAAGVPAALIAQRDDCEDLEGLFLRLTGRQLRD